MKMVGGLGIIYAEAYTAMNELLEALEEVIDDIH